MRTQFRLSDLIQAEFVVETIREDATAITVSARAASRSSSCPECGTTSRRVHSRYPRVVGDLPCSGRRIELHLTARCFICGVGHCRRKTIALLPDREPATVRAWLIQQPQIGIVARDRGGEYAQALPHADQVADRWHLMENASHAFLDTVRKSMRQVRMAIGTLIRQTSLEPHLPWLEAQWDAGLRNGAELWRQLQLAGFGSGLRVVSEWATRRRRAEKAENGLGHAPAAYTIVRLMTLERNNLTKVQTMTVAAIKERLPDLVEAFDLSP